MAFLLSSSLFFIFLFSLSLVYLSVCLIQFLSFCMYVFVNRSYNCLQVISLLRFIVKLSQWHTTVVHKVTLSLLFTMEPRKNKYREVKCCCLSEEFHNFYLSFTRIALKVCVKWRKKPTHIYKILAFDLGTLCRVFYFLSYPSLFLYPYLCFFSTTNSTGNAKCDRKKNELQQFKIDQWSLLLTFSFSHTQLSFLL